MSADDTSTETVYRAFWDQCATDPRKDNADDPTEPVLYIYAGAHTDRVDDHPVSEAFETLRQRHTSAFAAKVAQRYARVVLNEPRATVTLHSLHGYSQSDWWDVMVYVPDAKEAPNPDAYAHTLQAYLRGDIYVVAEYTKETCNLGHVHTTEIAALGGIFADSEDAAIAYYKGEHTV